MKNNKNFKYCISRKKYVCDNCGKTISEGNKYYRVNIKYRDIFHFCDEECSHEYFDKERNIDTYNCGDWDEV